VLWLTSSRGRSPRRSNPAGTGPWPANGTGRQRLVHHDVPPPPGDQLLDRPEQARVDRAEQQPDPAGTCHALQLAADHHGVGGEHSSRTARVLGSVTGGASHGRVSA